MDEDKLPRTLINYKPKGWRRCGQETQKKNLETQEEEIKTARHCTASLLQQDITHTLQADSNLKEKRN